MLTELIIIALLILLNGVFAMSEMAIVTARTARLSQRAQAGDRAARTALDLAAAPDRFLSTVQIGITLIGVLAGAYGGATLTEDVAAVFERMGAFGTARDEIALTVVVSGITLASLILGELVPKRLALAHADTLARVLAPPMRLLSRVAAPAVWMLSAGTRAALWLLRIRPATDTDVSEDDILHLIHQGARDGVIPGEERALLENVFRFGDRSVREVMIPFSDLVMLSNGMSDDEIAAVIAAHEHTRYPVHTGAPDNVLGVVSTTDLLLARLRVMGRDREGSPDSATPASSEPDAGTSATDLRSLARAVPFVPDSLTAHDALTRLRDTGSPAVFVVDEYGNLEGMVTIGSLSRTVLGHLDVGEDVPGMFRRDDGSWLVDAALPIRDFRERLPGRELPEPPSGVVTIGGLVIAALRRIPVTGEVLQLGALRVEVVDMDGHRLDKLLVSDLPASGGTR